MIDRLNPHLSDETLNEFLDQALEGPARSAVEAHLAECRSCSSRLAALGTVFSRLADLPPAPLGRDLRAGVMAAVWAQRPVALRPVAGRSRRAVQLAFGLQVLMGVALLGFAWPFLAGLLHPEQWLTTGGLGAVAGGLAGAWTDFASLWPAFQGWLATAAAQPAVPFVAVLQPVTAGLVLVAAGLFWFLGNAVLLRPRPAPRLRRQL